MKTFPPLIPVPGILLLVIALSIGSSGCKKTRDNFTEEDVQRIQNILQELNEEEYRIMLPVFRDGQVAGSQVYGTLPVTEIEQVAVSQGLSYSENGNLQAVFQSCSGGGAGSHVESESAAKGAGDRIEEIIRNIDKSQYVLIRK